jgi:hypothetical protein
MRLTGNPGGPGHQWVKDRYIEPSRDPLTQKMNSTIRGRSCARGSRIPSPGDLELERVFIPEQAGRQPAADGERSAVCRAAAAAGVRQLVKAWLEGDWDIVLGAFFDCWSPQRMCSALSTGWARFPRTRCGSGRLTGARLSPFSVGWYAISDGTWGLPKNALLKYREWYGSTGQPNGAEDGRRAWSPTALSSARQDEIIRYGVADPSHLCQGRRTKHR